MSSDQIEDAKMVAVLPVPTFREPAAKACFGGMSNREEETISACA